VHARGEDTIDSFARHDGIEEGPDPIVGGDDCFDMGSEVTCGAWADDVELGVVRAVQQQTVLQNEVGQKLVDGEASRSRIDDPSLGASANDERVHLIALYVCGRVRRAFRCEPNAQTLRESPDVEQHTAQDEELEALAKRSLATRSLCHRASLRGNCLG
jgi:hypothetical protein